MLFDDNFNFPSIDLFPAKKNISLVSEKIRLSRGNSFDNEYIPYKNYNPGILNATSERQVKLLEILELCFRKIDLNLCLDLEPNNRELLDEFKSCIDKLVKCESEFVKKFGPLELIDATSEATFTWINDPWPWEKGGNKDYV